MSWRVWLLERLREVASSSCAWCSDEEEEVDPWAKDVEALHLSRSGGLPGTMRVPQFLKVLQGADTRDKRLVTLKVHPAAPPDLAA